MSSSWQHLDLPPRGSRGGLGARGWPWRYGQCEEGEFRQSARHPQSTPRRLPRGPTRDHDVDERTAEVHVEGGTPWLAVRHHR